MLGGFELTVDGRPVVSRDWARRQAVSLVKVLALAARRRLHREHLIDLLWPDDAVAQALPKLHKAAHYARKALDVPDAVVLRDENVLLLPDAEVTIDVDRFDDMASVALAGRDVDAAHAALAIYGGELLPGDRYEAWAEERRDQLAFRHRELLRLAGRWDTLLELDPSDESAHIGLMR